MQIKFAAHVFPNVFPLPDLKTPFHFDDHTFAYKGSLNNYLSAEDNEHWKTWLGTLFWETITEKNPLICLAWKTTETPALDQEIHQLLDKLDRLYHALLLSGAWKNDGREAHTLTGTGQVDSAGNLKFERISQVGHFNLWRHPTYYESVGVWDWQFQGLKTQKALDFWKDNFSAIEHVIGNGQKNFLLTLALMAFQNGLHDTMLDFRIPNFVRAIEAVVALPAGKGKAEFTKRSGVLLPSTFSLPLGVDEKSITPILQESYQVRSDSVHGKPFADTLRASLGANFQAELPKYELGIEMAARYVIQNAIRNAKILGHSNQRDVLEAAWQQGSVP